MKHVLHLLLLAAAALQSPLQWDLPADTPPGTLSSRRSALLPGLTQLAVALPRAGGATAALAGLCSLQEAAGLDCSTVAGLLNAALQVRGGAHNGLEGWARDAMCMHCVVR